MVTHTLFKSCRYIAVPFLLQIVLISHSPLALASTDDVAHYSEVLIQIDSELQSSLSISTARPASWIHLERVAEAYLSRAQLTGNFDDYIASQETLRQAFHNAEAGSGPVLTRARLNFSIHRLPDVERDLIKAESALLVSEGTAQSIEEIRADVLFYSGQYALALDAYQRHEASNPGVNTATRLAHYHTSVADYAESERWFRKAEQRVTGQSSHLRSWLKLQLGILDLERGRLDDALTHFQEGLRLFPGFWLIEEHVAEIDALQGRNHLAEAAYRDLIQRTDSPQFMAALADILTVRADITDQEESSKWREKSEDIYEARIKKMPELVSGHAIDFFLQSDDSERALELAHYNYRLRPNSHSALLLIQAHTALGQTTEAFRLLYATLKTPYRSADLYATAGLLHRISGDTSKADEYDADALNINSAALQELDWLRWKLNSTKHAPVKF